MKPADPASKDAPQPSPQEAKRELAAISEAMESLGKLSQNGRIRAFSYMASAFGIAGFAEAAPIIDGGKINKLGHGFHKDSVGSNKKYPSFAELYDAARPNTGAEKALVGGYWFQICEKQEDFVSADVNKVLANVVGPLSNVTVAFDTLKAAKPSLVIQIGKSGKAQQARKKYKLTVAGVREVEEMIVRET